MVVTWYLCHQHNHIQVIMVVGSLAHICNNLSDGARSVYIRSVQYNDNSLRLWCCRLLNAPVSVTSGGVLCMCKGILAAKWTKMCPPQLTQLLRMHWGMWDDHWDVETQTGSFHQTCSDPNFNFWFSHVICTTYVWFVYKLMIYVVA